MKRSQRLAPVVKYTDAKEREAARLLAQQQQQLDQQKQRLKQLESYRQEYARQFIAIGSSGMSAIKVHDFQAFLKNLDGAMVQQKEAIERLTQDYEQKKRQWLAARNKTKAMHNVVDKYVEDEQRKEEKSEQKEQDDRSASRKFKPQF